MKKFCIALLICLTVLSLAACGGRNDTMPTDTTGSMPSILPTMDTNIPDPDTNGGTENPTWNTEPSDLGSGSTTPSTQGSTTDSTQSSTAASSQGNK